MKLTKEEYLDVLAFLHDEAAKEYDVDDDGELICYDCTQHDKYLKPYFILEQLINEHFDNPPLKFEELKEGMWVWDNKYKSYLKVIGFYGFNIHVKSGIGDYEHDYYIEFEENRFYRREV